MLSPPYTLGEDATYEIPLVGEFYTHRHDEIDLRTEGEKWVAPFREFHERGEYEALVSYLEGFEHYFPHGLDKSVTDTQYRMTEFLCAIAADAITSAFVRDDLDSVPLTLFEQMYAKPKVNPEPLAAALVAGALGDFHSEVDYEGRVIDRETLSVTGLITHLQLIWSVDPQRGVELYRRIMREGCPTIDAAEQAALDDPYVVFTQQFAANALNEESDPRSIRSHPYLNLDAIDERTGGKEMWEAERGELARAVDEFVDIDDLSSSTAEDVRRRR